jgi:hypothetical protein
VCPNLPVTGLFGVRHGGSPFERSPHHLGTSGLRDRWRPHCRWAPKSGTSICEASVVAPSIAKLPQAANVVGIVVQLDRDVAPVGTLPEQVKAASFASTR